ncbi:von willebrand factor type A domain protein [Rhizoctonia solani 123E]|uniref:von willebrand factor type A domain protein n=1 Tax=Rhizoctonia solani 123E TaxID=1423351 RepID=A0A074RZH4_9AGAM|nr:von willebrand factor type A domain protein [Rhizoctonia solani 123E]
MGQSSSQSTTDAVTPGSISGPMPLGSATVGGQQLRSASGSSSRLRRDRRRSRSITPSPSSPTITHASLSSSGHQSRTSAHRDSISTVATAPPPYTAEPARREVQLAEAPPPPVLPRDSSSHSRDHGYPREKRSSISFGQAGETVQSHQRPVSHSILMGPSSSRSRSPISRRPMPSLIPAGPPRLPGGFMAEMLTTQRRRESQGSEVECESPEETEFPSTGERGPRFDTELRAQAQGRCSTAWDRVHTPVVVSSRRGSKEDPLDMLKRYKTVMIVDDSSSMEGSSWVEAREALAGLADAAAKYDQEGIDVHFLNDHRVGTNIKNGVEVKRLFDYVTPKGITPTGEKLEELLLAYMNRLERAREEDPEGEFKSIKPVNFIVITDGAPTDDPESVIVSIARRLDTGHFPLMQVGIQFVQIGTAEDTAEALRELDDGLAHQHGIRDMVDTTPYTGSEFNTDLLVKILLGGINRRVDRYGAAAVV